MKKDHRGLNSASKPSGDGGLECRASPKGCWFHFRRCTKCGHIGCCDSSPSQHASKHAAITGHSIIASFEPGENWFFDYEKRGMTKGVELLPPYSHPEDQPTPGPAGESSSQLGIASALAGVEHFRSKRSVRERRSCGSILNRRGANWIRCAFSDERFPNTSRQPYARKNTTMKPIQTPIP